MTKTSIPHVSWRDGRPRFSPGRQLREAGHKGQDLRHGDGTWFTRGEAVDWSDRFIASLRPQPAPAALIAAPAQKPAGRAYTVARLFEDFWKSAKFTMPHDTHEATRQRAAGNIYSPKTVRDYKQKARVIENHDPSLWAAPVDALSQPVLLGLYDELVAGRGLATARGTLLVLSIALGWGKRRGKFTFRANNGVNPALDLGMRMAPPRVRFASRAEILTLVAAADHLGWHEMGDMIALGVWTGQRQEDRLLMTDKGLLNGRRIFRQAKTGAIVSVREAPELEARMATARARRASANIINSRVILDEQLWKPFPDDGDRYRKRFARLRQHAAEGIADAEATEALQAAWRARSGRGEPPVVWHVKPCPTLLGDTADGTLPFHEADLRSTAVTWMALGGATIPEIISVSGHTLVSATNILKHYLVVHPEMADSAIGKMIAWYEGDGTTDTGW